MFNAKLFPWCLMEVITIYFYLFDYFGYNTIKQLKMSVVQTNIFKINIRSPRMGMFWTLDNFVAPTGQNLKNILRDIMVQNKCLVKIVSKIASKRCCNIFSFIC